MLSAGLTDIGLVRKVNEDSFLCDFQLKDLHFYIVADGMGGHNAGEIASSMAIDYVRTYMEKIYMEILMTVENITFMIRKAIQYANERVYKKSIMNSQYVGMGTTFTLVCIYGDHMIIGHVGDSRVYRINSDGIVRLTNDHSLVEELLRNGTIGPEEAANHPQKNVITRALGTSYSIEVDTFVYPIVKEDNILVCSDGLTNEVGELEIQSIVERNTDMNLVCKELIDKAKDFGGYDNITVIVVRV